MTTARTKPVPTTPLCMVDSTITEDNDLTSESRENSRNPTAGDEVLLSAQQNAGVVIDEDGSHNVNSNGALPDEKSTEQDTPVDVNTTEE